MQYIDLHHDHEADTGANRLIHGGALETAHIQPGCPDIHKGDTVYVLELKYIDLYDNSLHWVREIYPTQMLADVGSHYWRLMALASIDLKKLHRRRTVATVDVVSDLPDELKQNVVVFEPDTLESAVPAPETLERPYDVRPGESTLDAYRRYLEEQEGT